VLYVLVPDSLGAALAGLAANASSARLAVLSGLAALAGAGVDLEQHEYGGVVCVDHHAATIGTVASVATQTGVSTIGNATTVD
jgi:hypothetical protein